MTESILDVTGAARYTIKDHFCGVIVTRVFDGHDFFLQGDDATEFRRELHRAIQKDESKKPPHFSCAIRVIENYSDYFEAPQEYEND